MKYAFDWVDAFSTRPFGGNACMVVHGAHELSIEQRLALVNETSLSECAYLVGSDVADFGARYYVAHQEILMAGHPTIATVTSLLDRGLVYFRASCCPRQCLPRILLLGPQRDAWLPIYGIMD